MAKAGGNYLSSQLIGLEAKRLGFVEGIGLAADGTVSEGAGENLFLVKDGVMYTPGVAHSLLARHHAPHGHARSRKTSASKCARSRSRAKCSTWPTNCSSPAPPTEVARHPLGRSQSRSATASVVRSPRSCRRPTSASCRARRQDKHGWLDYVDMNAPRRGRRRLIVRGWRHFRLRKWCLTPFFTDDQ